MLGEEKQIVSYMPYNKAYIKLKLIKSIFFRKYRKSYDIGIVSSICLFYILFHSYIILVVIELYLICNSFYFIYDLFCLFYLSLILFYFFVYFVCFIYNLSSLFLLMMCKFYRLQLN